jgi:hypothetical protein
MAEASTRVASRILALTQLSYSQLTTALECAPARPMV